MRNHKVLGNLPTPNVQSQFELCYQHPDHRKLPHVFKFSGGRSSAMLLMLLLHNSQLKANRGDVIIFNNTSAEHPSTYEFTILCKKIAEVKYKIPFFLTEFQTYEDAWLGRWRRAASYRLVKPSPYRYYRNRNSYGYKVNGEVFKEFVSWNSQLPTRFSRTCTEYLKLHTSVRFLQDWFGQCHTGRGPKRQTNRGVTRRLGHHYGSSKMPEPETYGRRAEIVRYHFSLPCYRESQKFSDFSDAPLKGFRNSHISPYVFDQKADFRGDRPMRFISVVGLRADEPVRVAKILDRNNTENDLKRLAEGEYVYAPLFDWEIEKQDVLNFWKKQVFDLNIPPETNLSTCVFCFMKGPRMIRDIARHSTGSGPSHIQWWADLESNYARVLESSQDPDRTTKFGFFGANSITYQDLIETVDISDKESQLSALPCECTD